MNKVEMKKSSDSPYEYSASSQTRGASPSDYTSRKPKPKPVLNQEDDMGMEVSSPPKSKKLRDRALTQEEKSWSQKMASGGGFK